MTARARVAECLLNAPQLPRAVPVFELAARRTVEIVPLLGMLGTDAADVALLMHQRPIAGWTKNAEFSLYVRAYWPDEAITRGQWTPPAVERQR